MKEREARGIEISALSISILMTVFAMLRAATWKIDFGALLIMLWTISPYICLFLADVGLRKTAPNLKMSSVFFAASLLMLGFTLLAYGGSPEGSSTYALIFLFVPFYLYLGGAIFLGGGLLRALLSKASRDKNT
jgi:hypothetical protein